MSHLSGFHCSIVLLATSFSVYGSCDEISIISFFSFFKKFRRMCGSIGTLWLFGMLGPCARRARCSQGHNDIGDTSTDTDWAYNRSLRLVLQMNALFTFQQASLGLLQKNPLKADRGVTTTIATFQKKRGHEEIDFFLLQVF